MNNSRRFNVSTAGNKSHRSQQLNGRAPPYLSEHCIPVSSADTRRHLRYANCHLLAVPRFRLSTYSRRAISVAGPMAWNSLPDFIRDPTSSTDCFRRLLRTYLFARYQCIQRIRGSQRLCAIQIHSLNHSLTHCAVNFYNTSVTLVNFIRQLLG